MKFLLSNPKPLYESRKIVIQRARLNRDFKNHPQRTGAGVNALRTSLGGVTRSPRQAVLLADLPHVHSLQPRPRAEQSGNPLLPKFLGARFKRSVLFQPSAKNRLGVAEPQISILLPLSGLPLLPFVFLQIGQTKPGHGYGFSLEGAPNELAADP